MKQFNFVTLIAFSPIPHPASTFPCYPQSTSANGATSCQPGPKAQESHRIVLQEGWTPADGYVVVYDPTAQCWGFVEQAADRDYSLVCRTDSLATALSSM
jgi:hypothetical protein